MSLSPDWRGECGRGCGSKGVGGRLSGGFRPGSAQVQPGAPGVLGQLCCRLTPPGLSRASEEPASIERRGRDEPDHPFVPRAQLIVKPPRDSGRPVDMPGALSGGAQSLPLVTKGPAGGHIGHSCTRLTPADRTGSRTRGLWGQGVEQAKAPSSRPRKRGLRGRWGFAVGWAPLSVSQPLVQWLRLPFPCNPLVLSEE